MRVAVLLGQINFVSGVGIAAVQEVKELREKGVDAELVVLLRIDDFDYRQAFEAKDIPVVFISDLVPKFATINFKFPFFSYFSFYHLTSVLWAPRVIKKRQYDAIIVHESYNCFTAIASARRTSTKIATFMWDPISYIIPRVYGDKIPKPILTFIGYFCHYFDRYILRNSDTIITGSSLHRKLFNFLVPKRELSVIPAGTRIEDKITIKRPNCILSLTKWDKGKNPDFLIEIARRLTNDFTWLVAGNWVDDEQKIEFSKKVEKYGLSKRIIVLGAVSERKKWKLYNSAKVLVHPIVEGFGMPVLEAAACGCPSIIPAGSGVTELFENNKHGFYPKEGDLNEYVSKIDLLLSDSCLFRRMGQLAWREAKKYSWTEHSEKIHQLLQRSIE